MNQMDAPSPSFSMPVLRPEDLDRLAKSGEAAQKSLEKTFAASAQSAKSFQKDIDGLEKSLLRLGQKQILEPLLKNLGQSLLSGLSGGLFSGAMPFANGGVISGGMVQPFAEGGVVRTPTYFPMQNGKTGLMGERGAEAILPLARGTDGRLGVQTQSAAPATTVHVTIQTPDAQSFQRSQGLVSATLARAVARGQRHL
jgi:phage-related minor tail protein